MYIRQLSTLQTLLKLTGMMNITKLLDPFKLIYFDNNRGARPTKLANIKLKPTGTFNLAVRVNSNDVT